MGTKLAGMPGGNRPTGFNTPGGPALADLIFNPAIQAADVIGLVFVGHQLSSATPAPPIVLATIRALICSGRPNSAFSSLALAEASS